MGFVFVYLKSYESIVAKKAFYHFICEKCAYLVFLDPEKLLDFDKYRIFVEWVNSTLLLEHYC